jgi:hypothetical protein
MLDYSIRGPLALSISPGFYGWTRSSNMVSEMRSWIQFSHAHTFSSAVRNNSYLPCCLLSTHMAQACGGRDSHARGGMLDYSIRGPLSPSILPGFYYWTGRGGAV